MTESLRAVVLALVQGITEFLPISSSAHLILPAQLWGWPDQGLAFDIAVHLGSLLAVIVYFRRDLTELAVGGFQGVRRGRFTPELYMIGLLIVASVPVGIAGLLFKGWIEVELRSAVVIAVSTIGFGLLLGLADRSRGDRALPGWSSALVIGLAQVLALVPGTSRSGVTITAALFCGLDRQAAARFSFLLSIPVILAAAGLTLVELLQSESRVDWPLLITAVCVSAATAYATIALFLRLLDRLGFMPFVIYRCLLGSVLLYLFAGS